MIKKGEVGFRKILLFITLCLPLMTGCQAMITQIKQPLENEGELLLYLQPFPQEAERIRFRIDRVAAIRSDGVEFPLSLRFSELKGREMTRQRLLGSVNLPAGSYGGFSIKVKDAYLRVEEGEAALLVPEGPARIELPFNVIRKKAYLAAAVFKPRDSLRGGFAFSPVFSASIPARPIAGLTGFVTNYASNNITIFDKKTGQASAVIATEGGPAGMALDQRGRKVYVAIPDSDSVDAIDVAAGEIINTIRLNVGDRPRELALTPDGRTLLTVNTGSNSVSIFDSLSAMESARIVVGNGPTSILVDPFGRRGYVFNGLSSTISVIDIANRALVTTVSTDAGPLRGKFNRLGDRFYVIHEWSGYVSLMDAATLTIVKRMSVGMGMRSIKVDTNTDLVYMGRERDPVVGVYEPFSFIPTDYVDTGGGVSYLTIDGEENNLVMVSPDRRGLVITNLISKKVLSLIDVGEAPYWVTVMGER